MNPSKSIKDNLGTNSDLFYEELTKIHSDLSESESHALNARLVLLMANEIGDVKRLAELFDFAKSCKND